MKNNTDTSLNDHFVTFKCILNLGADQDEKDSAKKGKELHAIMFFHAFYFSTSL